MIGRVGIPNATLGKSYILPYQNGAIQIPVPFAQHVW